MVYLLTMYTRSDSRGFLWFVVKILSVVALGGGGGGSRAIDVSIIVVVVELIETEEGPKV